MPRLDFGLATCRRANRRWYVVRRYNIGDPNVTILPMVQNCTGTGFAAAIFHATDDFPTFAVCFRSIQSAIPVYTVD
jgi:hypothetical protein